MRHVLHYLCVVAGWNTGSAGDGVVMAQRPYRVRRRGVRKLTNNSEKYVTISIPFMGNALLVTLALDIDITNDRQVDALAGAWWHLYAVLHSEILN